MLRIPRYISWGLCLVVLLLGISGCFSLRPGNEYDLLIVGPEAYRDPIEGYVSFKNSQIIKTQFAPIETIFAEVDGVDLAEKIRNYIRSEYEESSISYVLLVGDTTQVPTRYLYNPTDYYPELIEALDDPDLLELERMELEDQLQAMDEIVAEDDIAGAYVASDQYYANLYGDWDPNGNGRFGESKYFTPEEEGDEGSFEVNVYVGRIPARSLEELELAFKKLRQFKGWWSRRELPVFIGTTDVGPDPVLDAVAISQVYRERGLDNQQVQILIEDDGSLNYLSAVDRFNQNTPMVILATYGLPYGLAISGEKRTSYEGVPKDPNSFRGLESAEYVFLDGEANRDESDRAFLLSADISALENSQPYFLVIDSGLSGQFDYPSGSSMAERFLMQEYGAMGVVAQSRPSFGPEDRLKEAYLEEEGGIFTEYAPHIVHKLYVDNLPMGNALYQAKMEYASKHADLMSEPYQRRAVFGYNLFGDPSTTVFAKRKGE